MKFSNRTFQTPVFWTLALLTVLLASCSSIKPSAQNAQQSADAKSASAQTLLDQLKNRMEHPHTAPIKTPEVKQAVSISRHDPTVPPGPALLQAINPASGVNGDSNTRYLFISTADTAKKLGTPVVAPAFTDAYDKALDLIRQGKDDQALQKLQNLAMHNPLYSGPVLNEGLIYLKLGKYGSALKTLEAAVSINPLNPYAWNALGTALRYNGQFNEAKQAYEHAINLDGQYARAHFNLAVLAELYLQDLPLALKQYQMYQSLQTTPDPVVNRWMTDLSRRTGVHISPAPQTGGHS